jgi:GNAT superfamily N-acetyltransferase
MIDLRPATRADLDGMHRVWWAADSWAGATRKDNPWFGHVLRTGSMLVAAQGAEVVGFAGVRLVRSTTVVSDCFVHPDHQSRGIGTSLLTALVPSELPVMTFASADPKARSLYRRLGMRPQWECHHVTGDPRNLPAEASTVTEVDSYPIDESDLPHLRDDLGCVFVEAGKGRGALAGGSVESSRLSPGGSPAESLPAMLAWMAARGVETADIQIAEAHPAFHLLVAAGFAIGDSDLLMASQGAATPDPTRMTFNGDILRLDGEFSAAW